MDQWSVIEGDCREALRGLADGSVQTCITSPPYFGLRDYGVSGQIGLEDSVAEYVAAIVDVFREVKRVLADDGTLWLNLGDSYAGSWGNQGRKDERGTQRPINKPMMQNLKPYPDKQSNTGRITDAGLKAKDLIGVPWRVAFALQADGWYLRSDIVWHKPNPMPESVRDRPTKAHEYVFLLTKSPRYFYDADAIREPSQRPELIGEKRLSGVRGLEGQRGDVGRQHDYCHPSGRNKRTVWTITPKPFKGAHFAVMPPALVEPCILAGSRPSDLVLDPFNGAGTVGVVALTHGRRYVGIELNPEYAAMARERITREARPMLIAR